MNLTAYAAGNTTNCWVTVINKEHGTGARAASVTIVTRGITNGSAATMLLTAPGGDVTATDGITLGGAAITNHGPWLGQWTTLGSLTNGQWTLSVPAASAAIVQIVVGVNPSPVRLGYSVAGSQLTLSWPADHTGWRLLARTNGLIGGANWTELPGARSTNQAVIPVQPADGRVFYRLVYP